MCKTYLLFIIISSFFYSCRLEKGREAGMNNTILVEDKKIVFPLDEHTYYLSKSMFQFEEGGREYLHFENTRKSLYDIVVFDIESQQIAKRIPLNKTGPNGVPAVYGSSPFPGSRCILLSQNNAGRLTSVNDKGEVIRNYTVQTPDGRFTPFYFSSYIFLPAFCKDSCVYFMQRPLKSNMKREDWPKTHMFASLNLKTGQFNWTSVFYPSLFKEEYSNIAGGDGFTYDYNYKEDRLVCSFCEYDSLMVMDDLKHIRWYDAKSKYLKSIKPKLRNSMDGIKSVVQSCEIPQYWHLMYDKYRDVYYRFAIMPYKLASDESPYDEPKGKVFSVIILNKNFDVIGETKFPAKRYFYKMSFVGRDGLYISENNTANPEFDEDKLVFTCFKLRKK